MAGYHYSGNSGVLVVHKPYGMVSKDVSRILKKSYAGIRKIGHVGTLDPLAEGVLVVLLGSATRLQGAFLERPKTYEFTVKFGTATETMDTEGATVEERPFEHITSERIREIISEFQGEQLQTPPLYSAVKLHGQPLYKIFEAGMGIQLILIRQKKSAAAPARAFFMRRELHSFECMFQRHLRASSRNRYSFQAWYLRLFNQDKTD